VKELNTSEQGLPTELTVFDGRLFFAANDDLGDTELWVSDDIEAGTSLLKDIDTSGSGRPQDLFAVQPVSLDASSAQRRLRRTVFLPRAQLA